MNTRQAFCRFAAAAGVLLLSGWNARTARAEHHLDFTLHNKSNKSVYAIYVAPANSAAWGRNVLGRDVLFRGQSTRITFPGQSPSSPCFWDVNIVYSDGTSTQERFNLCQSRQVVAR
jgi:hypothetical protein